MKKKYIKKRRFKLNFIIVLIVFMSLFSLVKDISQNYKLFSSNSEMINSILSNNVKGKNIVNLLNYITKIDVNEPNSLIYIKDSKIDLQQEQPKELIVMKTIEKKPIVYIYNTHPHETYDSKDNIKNVVDASYYLQQKLKELNIESIVENQNVAEFLKANNWEYGYSYEVSKNYLLEVMRTTPSIKLYIDLHRDSVKKELSTLTHNGKKYAKTLFVVGLENKNYQNNLSIMEEYHQIINNKIPNLSRGIYKKEGKSVNGVYNQNLSSDIILLEMGSYQNTSEEVKNTIDVVSLVIKEKLGE